MLLTKWQKQFAIHKVVLQRLTLFLYRLDVFANQGSEKHNFAERFLKEIWENYYRWEESKFREHAIRDRNDPNIYSIPKKNIKPTKTRI